MGGRRSLRMPAAVPLLLGGAGLLTHAKRVPAADDDSEHSVLAAISLLLTELGKSAAAQLLPASPARGSATQTPPLLSAARFDEPPGTDANLFGRISKLFSLNSTVDKPRIAALNREISSKYSFYDKQVLYSREYQWNTIHQYGGCYDVVVIGGGATGAGVFLDLVTRYKNMDGLVQECKVCHTRTISHPNGASLNQQQPVELTTSMKHTQGRSAPCQSSNDGSHSGCQMQPSSLRVLLLESGDFSSGTSSKSTKLLHGGVRYLESAFWTMDFKQLDLVYEALDERATLLRICPYLNKRLPILMPVYLWYKLPYFYFGAKAYDIISGRQNIGWSYYLRPAKVLEIFPHLKNTQTGAASSSSSSGAQSRKTAPLSTYQHEKHQPLSSLPASVIADPSDASVEGIVIPAESQIQYPKNDTLQPKKNFGEWVLHYWSKIEKWIPNDPNSLNGAIVYYDGQTNDARLNTNIILTTMHLGGTALNYARVDGLDVESLSTKDVQQKFTARSLTVVDELSGTRFQLSAGVIINCTGPFSDELRKMETPSASERVVPSSGAHIALDAEQFGSKFNSEMGLLDPVTSDGRLLFILPWMGKIIAGTTDQQCKIDKEIKASNEDVNFIINEINTNLLSPDHQISINDVRSSWCGIRPLILDIDENSNDQAANNGYKKKTGSLARTHKITANPESNTITICGGKWTTYRRMAEEVVDFLIASQKWPNANCITKELLLIGSHNYTSKTAENLLQRYALKATATEIVDLSHIEHLVSEYGTNAEEILQLITQRDPLHSTTNSYTAFVSQLVERLSDPSLINFVSQQRREHNNTNNIIHNGPTADSLLYRLFALNKFLADMAEKKGCFHPLAPGLPYVNIEIYYNSFMACSKISDLLARRLRVTFLDHQQAEKIGSSIVAPLFAQMYPPPKKSTVSIAGENQQQHRSSTETLQLHNVHLTDFEGFMKTMRGGVEQT